MPFIRLTLATLLQVLLLVLLPGAPALAAASPANDDGQVSWAVRTASNDLGSDRDNYSYTLDPGQTLTDGLQVINHGKQPLELSVYAADGFTNEAGQLDLDTSDEKPTGIGLWVQTSRDSVSIPAGESVEVPFTVTLPENAPPGDHMGGIITSLTQPDVGKGINVDRRLAVRIRLRVGGELNPGLAVEDLHLTNDGSLNPFAQGSGTLSYTIHNTGNAILTARSDTSVHGPFGRFDADVAAVDDSPELLPGETWEVSAKVDDTAAAFRLDGTVSVTPLLVDASGSVTPLPAVTAQTHTWSIPWALLALAALALAVAALLVVRSRRRRRTLLQREQERLDRAVAEALRAHQTSDR